MEVVCLDLEGVLVPEIWINFAKKTGIKELEATTRDIPDYDVLMTQRLNILKQHNVFLVLDKEVAFLDGVKLMILKNSFVLT